mmetsp:Transcript_74298/g.166691  ORF Transcript_74298/g.166691 Transcript_74298/m.166691 type:complete len:252 (+) Transcript_74298:48-803(+)
MASRSCSAAASPRCRARFSLRRRALRLCDLRCHLSQGSHLPRLEDFPAAEHAGEVRPLTGPAAPALPARTCNLGAERRLPQAALERLPGRHGQLRDISPSIAVDDLRRDRFQRGLGRFDGGTLPIGRPLLSWDAEEVVDIVVKEAVGTLIIIKQRQGHAVLGCGLDGRGRVLGGGSSQGRGRLGRRRGGCARRRRHCSGWWPGGPGDIVSDGSAAQQRPQDVVVIGLNDAMAAPRRSGALSLRPLQNIFDE